jgi:hypothetical protein
VLNLCLLFLYPNVLLYSVGEESYSSGTRPPSRIRQPFSSIPSVRSSSPLRFLRRSHPTLSYYTFPYLPNTLSNKNNHHFFKSFPPAERRTGRWSSQLCARLPLLRVHLHRPSRPAHPIPRVIYNPFLEHLYRGVRGASSFLHTHTPALVTGTDTEIGVPQRLPLARASARPLPSLAGALIAVEWGSDRTQEPIRCKADSFRLLLLRHPMASWPTLCALSGALR